MNIKESIIQYQVWRLHHFLNVFPNIHTDEWGGSEVDALYLTNTNRAYFYEIKCSKADFKNDLKKERHKLFLNRSSEIRVKPKHFIYLCYGFIPELSEIPEYAGCYLVNDRFLIDKYNPYKKPPILFKEPLTESNMVFLNKKIYTRYSKLANDFGFKEYWKTR